MDVTAVNRLAVGLVLALAGASVFADRADGKFECEHRPQQASVELTGLPATPLAGKTYTVTTDLPARPAGNPHPLLFLARCERRQYEPGRYRLRATGDSAQFPGRAAGAAGYAFDLRFGRPGRWLIVSMDVSGRFRDFGFRRVGPQPSSQASSQEGESDLGSVLIVAASGLVAATVMLAARRRRVARGGG